MNEDIKDKNEELENTEVEDIQEEAIETEHEVVDKQAEELAKIQQVAEEYKDKYLRLYAEFDNFKRRNAKEKLDLIKSAGQDTIKTLLPILDDIKRAEATYEQDKNAETFANGTQLINDKLIKSLQQKGLAKMDCVGKDFDTEFHEAIAEIPAPNPELKGKIIDVVEDGYTLNDVIIRYAKVVVGK